MKASLFTLETPDGPFSVISSVQTDRLPGTAVVLASGWTSDLAELTSRIHPSLQPSAIAESAPDARIKAAVEAYYAGDFAAIEQIEVLQKSGPFRSHAWEVLRKVAPGAPVTYSDYAELSGNPKAIRAAASACAFNAAALFVPCHRVVRLDGGMGGFRWGLPVKERLLARESVSAQDFGKVTSQ